MHKLSILAGLATLSILAGSASADPTRCIITKIKDKDVSIDVPVDAKIGPDIFCKTGAQRVAKQYAVDNPVCERTNARESTFALTATWGKDGKVQTFELKTYCPKLAARK
jgi:hypothetical protein